MLQKNSIRLAIMAATALGLGACGDDPSSPSQDAESVGEYVASVSIDSTPGTLRTEGAPRPTTQGPTLFVDGHLTIVNGGTATLNITSPTPFETVYVAGSTPISKLFIPVNGFYEIVLPAPTTSASLLIAFSQELPGTDFDLYFAAADASGKVGTLAERSFNALIVGTGDVQVTVNWDTDSDVDLHVVDPAGWEIYWADRQSPTGGALDLDSNAACNVDGVRNENITWAAGYARQGTYTVRVDYWSSCGAAATNYTVLINNGGEVAIYHGTFTGTGDQGGFGSGVPIDTFTRTTGPLARPSTNRPDRALPDGPARKETSTR